MAQELKVHGFKLFYYDNKKKGEVEFLLDDYANLSALPIEVKSGKDYKTHSALDAFIATPEYNIKSAVVLNNSSEVKSQDGILYMPIYYAMFIREFVPENLILEVPQLQKNPRLVAGGRGLMVAVCDALNSTQSRL